MGRNTGSHGYSREAYPSDASNTYGTHSSAYTTTLHQERSRDRNRDRPPSSTPIPSKYTTSPEYNTFDATSSYDTRYTYNTPPGNNTTPQTPYTLPPQSSIAPYYSPNPEYQYDTSLYQGQNYGYNSPRSIRNPNTDRAGDSYTLDEISSFIRTFEKDRNQYLSLEQEIGARVKQKLNEKHIEHLWQSRVKEPHSLETKLRGRKHQYTNDQENCASIKDLIACRIVLPRLASDLEVVASLIRRYFSLVSEKSHPEPGSSGGYTGYHFYMTMLQQDLSNVTVEIQVMTPFMYGYMAQEHDIRYKQLQGVITLNDIINLENLQSAAQQGDAASEQLQGRRINSREGRRR